MDRCEIQKVGFHAFKELIGEIQNQVDFSSCTRDELEDMCFTPYTLDNEERIMLVPSYIMPAIPEGTVLTDICGDKLTVGVDKIDNDSRGGFLSYGIPAAPLYKGLLN